MSIVTEIAPGFFVHRMLPTRARRTIGAWCFLDHFGPLDIAESGGMHVPPHPHIGLQTVTWLFEGALVHRDSLGSIARIEPGTLNVMTAGSGIAHAEVSAQDAPPALHGVQLWVGLPDASRHEPPMFEHHLHLPSANIGPIVATTFFGSFAGVASPARTFSPIVGVELRFIDEGRAELPLNPRFEHGILRVAGSAFVDGADMAAETLYHFEPGRDRLVVDGIEDSRLLLLGGIPFEEHLLMWWNFVARTADELAQARSDWEDGSARFGEVPDAGKRMPAPPFV